MITTLGGCIMKKRRSSQAGKGLTWSEGRGLVIRIKLTIYNDMFKGFIIHQQIYR